MNQTMEEIEKRFVDITKAYKAYVFESVATLVTNWFLSKVDR